jgi:hypothetical protein
MTPPITAWPMGARCSEPSVSAKASGTMPKTIASVVIRIGRSRTRAACSRACVRSMPASRDRMAKSTSRMAFFVTSPISMTMPMMENMFSVEPKNSSASTTPISVSGSELISASGCRKLLNWLARIM